MPLFVLEPAGEGWSGVVSKAEEGDKPVHYDRRLGLGIVCGVIRSPLTRAVVLRQRKEPAMAQTAKNYDGKLGNAILGAAADEGFKVKGKASKKRPGARAYKVKHRDGRAWEVEIRTLASDKSATA